MTVGVCAHNKHRLSTSEVVHSLDAVYSHSLGGLEVCTDHLESIVVVFQDSSERIGLLIAVVLGSLMLL